MVYSDNENMVLILSRKHTKLEVKEDNRPISEITTLDIWPVLQIAIANSDVVILKEGSEFVVIRHRYMNIVGEVYNINSLTNITFAR